MQSVTKFLRPHLQDLVRTAIRRNMTPPFNLHLTGPKGDHFQCQIDEMGQILLRDGLTSTLAALVAYLPLRMTLVDG
jgi:hypothetical protein